MSKHVVATVEDIPPGSCKIVSVKGREIGVFNIGNEFFALANRCPHQGAPLCRGDIVSRAESPRPGQYSLSKVGEIIRCPWHCWEFDIKTGESWCEPEVVRARRFEAKVASGGLMEEENISAEKIIVEIDRKYVVVVV